MIQYVQKSNCETTHLDDEWIVLNIDAFTVTKLNEVGGFCWSLLKDVQTVDSLVKAVEQQFHSEAGINREEIEGFLTELVDYGLVVNDI